MKNMKRMIAMVLVLCSVMSFVPSMAIAVGDGSGGADPVTVTYDFELEKTTLTTTSGGSFANNNLPGAAVSGAIAGYYDSGELNWKYDSNNHQSFKTDSTTVSEMMYFGGNGSGNAWKGLRVGVKVTGGSNGQYPIGHWMALNIKVPTAGKYDLTLNHQLRADGTTAGKVYLLEGTYADTAAIEAAMTASNLQATVDFSKTNFTYEDKTTALGEATLKAGEYTIVFHATADRTGGAGCYFYLRNLVAELKEESQNTPLTNVSYDFSLANINAVSGGTGYTNKYFYNSNIPYADIDAMYDASTLNWKIAASNASLLVGGDVTKAESYLSYGNGSSTWTGLRLAMRLTKSDSTTPYTAGHWFAFNLKGPGAGTYEATLNYQTRSEGNRDVKVYLIPGALTDASAIQTAIDSATSLTSGFEGHKDATGATGNYLAGVKDLGDVTLVDGDYTLVVHCASETGTYFFLNGLDLQEKDPTVPTTTPSTTTETTVAPTTATTTEGTTEGSGGDDVPVDYSFELSGTNLTNTNGGSFMQAILTDAKVKNAIDNYYAQGVLSWKYALDNVDTFDTFDETTGDPLLKSNNTFYFGGGGYAWTGLRLGMMHKEGNNANQYPAGWWAAFTVKAPGTGTYDVKLDYQTRGDGTPEGEIYMIKGTFTDVAALEAQMTEANLLKVIDFSSNTSKFADATRNLGTVEFSADEYTLVIKAASKKASAGGAYAYINGLTFEEKVSLPPVQVDSLKYDFELTKGGYTAIDGSALVSKTLDSNGVVAALEEYYANRTLYWKYSLDNLDTFKTDTNTVSSTHYIGGNDHYKWDGVRLGMLITENGKKRYPAGWWTALTIYSPGKGNYQFTLNVQQRADVTPAGEVYLIKGTFTDPAELEKQMTRDNLRQVVDSRSKTSTFAAPVAYDLGIMAMEQGEYTLVFKAKTASAGGAYMYINSMTATKTNKAPYVPELPEEEKPVEVTPQYYNFELNASPLRDVNGAKMGGSTMTDDKVMDALKKYYDEGMISWLYATDNLSTFAKNGTKVGNTYYIGGSDTYKWDGIRFGMVTTDANGKKSYSTPGWWTAFTLKSPGKGTHYLTLEYQKRSDAAVRAEIYLIKGKLTDVKSVEAQMTKANLLKEVEMKSKTAEFKDASEYLGPVTMEDGEYTLVIKCLEGNPAGAYIYMNNLDFAKNPPPEPTEIVYNFDLNNKEDGIYTGKANFWDKTSDIAQRYANDKLNWKYETKDDSFDGGANAFNAAYGMVMYTSEENWMAFRIKSPGAGLYTMILNHARSARGALGAMYILPGDTKDIAAAMDHGNRVGKIQFYNDTGDVKVKNGSTTTMGTYNFERNKEYIVVFEAYDNTPYQRTVAYMWISQLIAKKGDHTVSSVGKRQIQSMVVDPEPCPTMEPTIALVAAEIDGQDYLFMPAEGRALYIFNLEDNVMVRKVTGTPFPICRGITVDKDGMIWAVGDAQVLWRYDFRTNTGWKSYNYKFNGIDDAGCGYGMTTDDEGNIYFGTNPCATIAKYDPQTNKFSKVGGEKLDHVDGDYANVPLIKDGYCYATVAGDKNSDGKKTAYVVKIDLATNKVVDRLDISTQFGEDEVMVRGGGICGNMLFLGGISMKDYVAVDISGEKMQLKTYDVLYGQIMYSPTEEIDGKCYMIVGGKPFMYDSATDTFERIYGMDNATIGFRPIGHSSVTLSNNPLFPDTSYVTYSSTGVKYYNFDTKQVMTPTLYDEDKEGSGQIVRVVVSGEPGDNNIYIGGYNTVNCAKIDLETGITSQFKATSSQTDALLWYEGILYAGNYNAGNAVRINFEDEDKNVILKSFKSQYHQSRVHALEAGDGKLFIGTIPDSFLFGGCLGITDLETLETHVEHDMIPGQIVTSLAYNDGIIFGGTSANGGTGASRPEEEKPSAVIFAYDVENKKLLATLDMRDYYPQLPEKLDYIDGIQADPNIDENGRVWGMIGEAMFNFTFDKETNTFKVNKFLEYGYTQPGNISRGWDAIPFAFDGNGNIYACFHTTGGLRRVNMANPSDNERINCEIPKTFCLGNDGNLYYAIGTGEIKMFPLNVTEKDWEMAENVDILINSIGKVTLENEKAIVAAREAYDALDVGHRALVQLYDKLLEAETDLLELKIDTIGEVSLEKEEMINGLLATYEAMPLKEQKYVKNYQTLNKANIELQKLVNERAAKAYQKKLDETLEVLGEITLEDESQVRALRDAYDELIFAQRQLVDAKGLFEAEAAVKALRQVRIDYLIELVGKIGSPVTLADEPIINEAMEIYEWLYMDEREQVDYTTLVAAQKSLQKLQKAAAGEVDVLIEAIGGSVNYGSGAAIKAAREGYEALTEGSKQYVKLYDILVEAENIYNSMFPIWAIIVIAVVVVGGGAAAVVVVLKKRKGKKSVAKEAPAETQE